MLDAAATVFATTSAPESVTMGTIAVAAGVGKGTLFRAFGDRDGLLDALAAERFQPLRTAVEHAEGDFAVGRPAEQRIVSFLDAVLTFKLENHSLMRAREAASTTSRSSDRYRWSYDVLRGLLADALALPASAHRSPHYLAHALLALVQIDLVDELLAGGLSVDDLRRQQAEQVTAALAGRS
jgi:AcrR family transcriptional regulator